MITETTRTGVTKTRTAIDLKYGQVRQPWFLNFAGSAFGPYSESEVVTILKSGRLNGQIYVWRKGMGDWIAVQDCQELQKL